MKDAPYIRFAEAADPKIAFHCDIRGEPIYEGSSYYKCAELDDMRICNDCWKKLIENSVVKTAQKEEV